MGQYQPRKKKSRKFSFAFLCMYVVGLFEIQLMAIASLPSTLKHTRQTNRSENKEDNQVGRLKLDLKPAKPAIQVYS